MNDLAHDLTNARPTDIIRERVDALSLAASEWANKVPEIADEDTARRADDFVNQLTAEAKRVAEQIKQEKAPHQEAVRAIDLTYGPLRLAIETSKALIVPKLAAWLGRKRRAAEAEAKHRQEEAERLARDAAEAAARAEKPGGNVVEKTVQAQVLAERAAEAQKAAARPVERAQVRGSYSARARTLRTHWYAEVDDVVSAFAHYQAHPKVKEVLTELASADARAGGRDIPGCRVLSREIAA